MEINVFFMLLGLIALLFVMFQRASGFALPGSLMSLGITVAVMLMAANSSLPELVGLLYLAAAVGVWVASPPAEEVAETIGGTIQDGKVRLPASDAPVPALPTRVERVSSTLTALDHVWLVGLPICGFLVCNVLLPQRTALQDGLYFALAGGRIGKELAVAVTDISALFGLLFVFPVGKIVLTIPVTGFLALASQSLRGRPTAFAAAIEFGMVLCLLNIIGLAAFPFK